jgi:hypothetical protein
MQNRLPQAMQDDARLPAPPNRNLVALVPEKANLTNQSEAEKSEADIPSLRQNHAHKSFQVPSDCLGGSPSTT